MRIKQYSQLGMNQIVEIVIKIVIKNIYNFILGLV